jgi:methionyl-tRNA formyltransferase
MSPTILFFGNERLATGLSTTAPTLRALIAAGYNVAAVVVAQNDTGQSRNTRGLEIAAVAAEHNIPVIAPVDLQAAVDDLAAYGATAAVLVAYGKIVPQSVIDIFPRGIINIHPSLLPKHRGSIPIESVILNGETETGVSLMQLTAKMDAGPVYAQATIKVSATASKQALSETLSDRAVALLIEQVLAILDGSLQPIPQDNAAASYDKLIEKQDGIIDCIKPAVQLEREVRAYLGWPRSRARLGNHDVIITQSHVQAGDGEVGSLYLENKQLGLHTSNGVLIIDALVPNGKKEMPTTAFLAGHRL